MNYLILAAVFVVLIVAFILSRRNPEPMVALEITQPLTERGNSMAFLLTDEETKRFKVVGKTAGGKEKPVDAPIVWAVDPAERGSYANQADPEVDFAAGTVGDGKMSVSAMGLTGTADVTVSSAPVASLEIAEAAAPAPAPVTTLEIKPAG